MAENPQEMAREILPVNIEDELKQSYMDYAMSVIVAGIARRPRWAQAGAPKSVIRHERAE